MKNFNQELSYVRQFYMCSVNEKGSISLIKSSEITACFVVGAILELMSNGNVVLDEKERLVEGEPLEENHYLQPVLTKILSYKKPKRIKDIGADCVFEITDKTIRSLLQAMGESLYKDGYADEVRTKRSVKYAPKPDAVYAIIKEVREELLENAKIEMNTVVLTALLDRSLLLNRCFSKIEKPMLKARLKEIKTSDAYAEIKKTIDYIDTIITIIIVATAAAR